MKKLLLAALLALAFILPAHAENPEADVPENLKSWIPWVLRDRDPKECPFAYNAFDQKGCRWLSRLALTVDSKGGGFLLNGRIYKETWATLPGDSRHWPLDVKVNGAPATVIERDGWPALFLQSGNYEISGVFAWDEVPEMLPVPPVAALLSLAVEGVAEPFPNVDLEGRLWIKKQKEQLRADRDHLDVTVFRKITDSIPLTVATRIRLNVSGKNRDALLEPALLEGFVPLAVSGSLPARMENDGRLRVRLRPGTWEVAVLARHEGEVAALALPEAKEPWPAEEIWVFEPQPQLRQVQVEGVAPIDPLQTELPGEWRGFPAYYLNTGSTMALTEKQRGDTDSTQDALSIQKQWWLDSDGKGYTVRDHITGAAYKSWRLEALPEVDLGRASVNGADQFITRLSEDGAPGVEIRESTINLEADSRIHGNITEISAVGWNHDFNDASGVLYLPPGWSLFAATGADKAPGSWISRWSLLDVFLVLIGAVVMYRLMGLRGGLVGLITLVLLHTEMAGLAWTALFILSMIALARVLPKGNFRIIADVLRKASLLALIIGSLVFMVTHLRENIYPQLKEPRDYSREYARTKAGRETYIAQPQMAMDMVAPMPMAAPPPLMAERASEADAYYDGGQKAKRSRIASAIPGIGGAYTLNQSAKEEMVRQNRYQYDPSVTVQTGYGIANANWRGSSYTLLWNGPVDSVQTLRLWLVSPQMNVVLAFLRVLLLAAFLLFLLEFKHIVNPPKRQRSGVTAASAATALLLLLSAVASAPATAAEYPPEEMLQQLQQHMLKELDKKPECLPSCATLPRMHIAVADNNLALRLEVHAAESISLPLPGGTQNWRPATVLVNGAAAEALSVDRSQGYMWIAVPKGVHQVLLAGPLPERDTVSLGLPLLPNYSQATAQGWEVMGIHENGHTDGTIQLVRQKRAADSAATAKSEDEFETGELPPFVMVERDIFLGNTWTVETRVSRMSPAGSAVVAAIPLLAGESVTTPDIRVENGKVKMALAPQAYEISWSSILKPAESIALAAPKSVPWVEVWRVFPSNLWHAKAEGIPTVQNNAAEKMLEWRPWPGETVTLATHKPEGAAGRTKTIDSTQLSVQVGERATEYQLQFQVRSSRGDQHEIVLPEHAELQKVLINGAPQPIQLKERTLPLPLMPGSQQIGVHWKQPEGITKRFTVPAVDMKLDSVNAETQVTLPQDRWVLFVGGPTMGPAVLFWGILPLFVLAAVGLGLTKYTPLRIRHWLLLFVGLSQVNIASTFIIVGWFLAMGWRQKSAEMKMDSMLFDLRQMVLGLWTLVMVACLFHGIEQGLLGSPDMRIVGNGSSSYALRWYQDISGETLPQPWCVSVPLSFYRGLMLLWALWLAFSATRWMKWGWYAFSSGGYWRRDPAPERKPIEPAPIAKDKKDSGKDKKE